MIEEGMMRVEDAIGSRSLKIEAFDARIAPGDHLSFDARRIIGRMRLSGGENDPTFGAERDRGRRGDRGVAARPYPQVRVTKGYVSRCCRRCR